MLTFFPHFLLPGLHKGLAVNHMLQQLHVERTLKEQLSKDVDFILCVGDDNADEPMFKTVLDYVGGSGSGTRNVFTCTVGLKPSQAQYFVQSCDDVLAMLEILAKE